jgi:hypothetical protein
MKKFINFINIPGHIIKYRKRRIIDKFTGEKREGVGVKLLIKIVLIIGYLVTLLTVNYIYKSKIVLIITAVISLIAVMVMILLKKKRIWSFGMDNTALTKIILKDDDGKYIKTWELNSSISLIIGKKTKNNEIDIDLSDTVYASLISREHAVLNFTGKQWYFEDIGSSNGSGIKRKSEGKKFKVEEGQAYRLYTGDTIYIANTQMLVK